MAERSESERHELQLPCAVRGYQVYKAVWDPYFVIGDDFTMKHERNNLHDKYAITNSFRLLFLANYLLFAPTRVSIETISTPIT